VNELNEQIALLLKHDGARALAWEDVLRVVLKRFRSETGTIHRLEPDCQSLCLVAQIGLPPEMLAVVQTVPVGKGIAGQVVARGEPVTICNLQTDSSGMARPGAKQSGVGGALCVPTRAGDKITGAIGIGTVRPYEYTPEETRILEEIGRTLGDFLKS
jgi:L-methionine (R)-S-oxide reductase